MASRRWYDNNKELSRVLNDIKSLETDLRIQVVQGVLNLVNNANPNLIENFIANYRFDIFKNRWYDEDPYLWLIYNGLYYGDEKLKNDVIEFLKQKIIY